LLNWLIFPFVPIICLSFLSKIVTLIICFLGGIIGFYISYIKFYLINKSLNNYFFTYYFSSIWFLPSLSTIGSTFLPLAIGLKILKSLDQGWMEFFGVQKIFSYFIILTNVNQYIQFNNLKIYLTLFVFWVFALYLFLIFLYLDSLYFRVWFWSSQGNFF
jgi:hypothetical protein